MSAQAQITENLREELKSSPREHKLLQIFRTLPHEMQEEILDFTLFIRQKLYSGTTSAQPIEQNNPVEETWGTIKIAKDLIHYIAEDEELEYDV